MKSNKKFPSLCCSKQGDVSLYIINFLIHSCRVKLAMLFYKRLKPGQEACVSDLCTQEVESGALWVPSPYRLQSKPLSQKSKIK